jgi:hypothetical protein
VTIQPIPTRYAGYHFRSRLEARWAVFFDTLRISWEYEPEGFQTSLGWYLPDFHIRVPDDSYPYWFEVKPEGAPDDARHRALCVETATPFIVARGLPRDYHDQLKGHRSPLTALLWGDRLEGARYPAGNAAPEIYPCAFVGPGHTGSLSEEGHWDAIHKARSFECSTFEDTHIALYTMHTGWHGPREGLVSAEENHAHRAPAFSSAVDAAYRAARSSRFEFGQFGGTPTSTPSALGLVEPFNLNAGSSDADLARAVAARVAGSLPPSAWPEIATRLHTLIDPRNSRGPRP